MSKPTKKNVQSKQSPSRTTPKKPHNDFLLTWHPSGYWCKKILGKLHYFGSRWGDPDEALDEYLDVKDDLLAGREPREQNGELTIHDGINEFLTDRKHRVEAGELTQRSFDDYYSTCERVLSSFGSRRVVEDLGPSDFLALKSKFSKKWGPVTVGNEVARVRVLFKYLWDADLLDKPVRVGPSFKRPSRKTLRKAKAKGRRKNVGGR